MLHLQMASQAVEIREQCVLVDAGKREERPCIPRRIQGYVESLHDGRSVLLQGSEELLVEREDTPLRHLACGHTHWIDCSNVGAELLRTLYEILLIVSIKVEVRICD